MLIRGGADLLRTGSIRNCSATDLGEADWRHPRNLSGLLLEVKLGVSVLAANKKLRVFW